jgi:hypothetical protein
MVLPVGIFISLMVLVNSALLRIWCLVVPIRGVYNSARTAAAFWVIEPTPDTMGLRGMAGL